MEDSTRKSVRTVVLKSIPILFVLLSWLIVAESGLLRPLQLPSPILVAQSLAQTLISGELAVHALASVGRVLVSFALILFLAIPIGVALGWYRQVGEAFGPLVELFRTISPISWIPLAILWFGIGNEPAIFILFMSGFFPLLIASSNAVSQVNPVFIKVANNMGASDSTMLVQVILPASIPYIFVAARISLGIIWVVVVAAEMAGLRNGLGYLILDGRNLLRTDLVMGGMLVIGLIGLCLDRLMLIGEASLRKRGFLQ